MKYVKLFQTHSGYEEYISGETAAHPNVSYCRQEQEVHYEPMKRDYSKEYLTFEALSNNVTISWDARGKWNHTLYPGSPMEYSINDGGSWNQVSDGQLTTLNRGEKMLLRAINNTYAFNDSGTLAVPKFVSNGDFIAYGNILSIIYGDNFSENTTLNGSLPTFAGNEHIVSAENLVMPSEFGVSGSARNMFSDCTNLTAAPELPATTLANYCYYSMFAYCTSLTVAPSILPAETLATNCYSYMFNECTNLTTAPELPATTLADSCYTGMFFDCDSLTTAPALPATTLAPSCYVLMFYNCNGLEREAEVPDIFTPNNRVTDCTHMYGETNLTYDAVNGVYPLSAYEIYSPK